MQAVQTDHLTARLLDSRPLAGIQAASSLAWFDDQLALVRDDAASLVMVDPETGHTQSLPLVGSGEALPKPLKPDLEAIAPGPDGRLYLFGSGSTARREQIFAVDPRQGRIETIDAHPLYTALARSLGTPPNIEGALFREDELWLFHRGNGCDPESNALIQVTREAFWTGPIRRVTRWDLGQIAGVQLSWTDAIALDGERILFLAVAEDTPNAYDDGPVVGASLGLLGPQGAIWTPICNGTGQVSCQKFEGLALAHAQGTIYLVNDPDSPDQTAELWRVAVTGLDAGNPA